MIQLGDLIVILDLHRQGLSVSAIARRTGRDPKTIRKYIAPRPRAAELRPTPGFPDLTAVRLLREVRERGYGGAYTAVKPFLRAVRPSQPAPFEVRFEPPPGQQAQVDFARF